jgi:hypothetical protein
MNSLEYQVRMVMMLKQNESTLATLFRDVRTVKEVINGQHTLTKELTEGD